MKRASFTLFQPQRWMSKLGQSALMVLFVWCCLGITNVTAQVRMDFDGSSAARNTCTVHKATACNGSPSDSSTEFTDDGENDGNYVDTRARVDTTEFCPTDSWHHVKVVFTKFDLEPAGDVLEVYQGNKAAVRGAANDGVGPGLAPDSNNPLTSGVASGTGVPQAFGGWVDANCDPADNPSGCLTFILRTDGDNIKGAGWEAWVDCAADNIHFDNVTIQGVKLTCADTHAYGIVTIPAAAIDVTGSDAAACPVDDSLRMVVQNQFGETCIDTCLSATSRFGLAPSVVDTFAIGIYSVKYTLKSDVTKTLGTTFSVQAPSLVCNDDVIVPLGSACMIALTPDDLLEQPCDTIRGIMYYNITVTLGSGPKQVVKRTTGHNNLGPVSYPIITAADIVNAGMSVCGGMATVTVERLYYQDRNGDGQPDLPMLESGNTICNNNTQSASCSTNVRFEDQSAPFINIKGIDSLVACDTTGLDKLLSMTAIDNCVENLPVSYTVTLPSDPCFVNDGDADAGFTTVTIVASATDACGNTGRSTKRVVLVRPTLEDHIAQVTNGPLVRDCKDTDNASETPGVEIGVYNNGMLDRTQPVDTVHLSETEYICGYILTKRDIDIPETDCGRKIYRYWSVTDWCNPGIGPSVIDTTFIEYTDNEQPYFVDTLDSRINILFGSAGEKILNPRYTDVELGPFDCTYNLFSLPKPAVTDNCDDDPTVSLTGVWRVENGAPWIVSSSLWATIDCDSFILQWTADDECHEQPINDVAYQYVQILDVTNPSAVCTDHLNVSVPSDGGARIHYSDIDAGSVDACGIDKIEIRRKDSGDAWGEYVDVVCEDVHDGLQIEMRVTDKKGNTNICWMDVTAEDKIPPVCQDLPDVSRTCNEFHNGELGADTGGGFAPLTGDLMATYNNYFGNPVCEDNLTCGILDIEQFYMLTELNCGALQITRKWRANDWTPNVSSNEGFQNITISYVPDWKLTFPADVDLSCGDEFPAAGTAASIISNGSCDLWAVEVTEKTFEVPGDICMKVERTYELINWCVYQAGDPGVVIANNPEGAMVTSEGNETVGRFTYVQVLKLYVNEPPTITIDEVETCLVGEGDVAPYGVEDITPGAAPFECDEERTFSASATNCAGVALGSSNFVWKYYVDGALADEGEGSSFTKVVQPKSRYKVEFWVTDGCGNSAGDDYEVEFWDCKKPTPYVLNGLAVEIMQTGSIQLWATDLDQGSFDNCTPREQLDIRIAIGDPTEGPQDLAGVQALEKVVTLDCNNLGTQSVSIYVIDAEENWDVVGTYVLVQNNMGACGQTIDEMGRIGGKVTNPVGENVELVNVSINGGANTMATGATGTYQFDLAQGGDYTITPEKNINPLNGVSTYDLVLISKHILGITPFDSPYKYIAADVNKSGSITAFDMVQLRQLILNITSEFPNNTSWRFVDSKHDFSNATNPAAENFNEFMTVNNLTGELMDIDFVATKIGDVNGNAQANSLLGAESRTTNGTLSLNVVDRLVEAGQTVTVDFNAADIAQAQGYQFTMNFAGLELVELVEGVAKASNFNTTIADRGVLTTSWNGEATADEVLFSLTFTANTTGLLSELVSVNSDLTTAEAYNTAGELLDVNLDFTAPVSAAFELSQNTPNPFNGETLIGFNLPEAASATLTVMDVQGKVLKSIKADYAKGYNTVTLKASELGATGVLYYQLESSDNIATKKMIIIE